VKIGLCLPNYGHLAATTALSDFALEAEALGYSSLWATDHIVVPSAHADPFGTTWEALTTLAWLAGLTHRVTLGTSVLVLPQREPLLVAKQAATIDQLSRGRLVLGIGVGWIEQEFNWLRSPFRGRGAITDEWIALMRAAWRPGPINFSGRWVQVADGISEPKPYRPNGIPIVVGGHSEQAVRRAATLGDGWHPTTLSPDAFRTAASSLREKYPEKAVPISMRMTTEPEGDLAQWQARYGAGRWLLTGNADQMIATIREWEAAGLDELVLYFTAQMRGELPELFAALRWFGQRVLPAFSS
jgi:probable F420-dependent oxidoreductase